MAELPLAPLVRIMKNNGVERVSKEAQEAMAKAVEEYVAALSRETANLAKHAGRKTVSGYDVELAVKRLRG